MTTHSYSASVVFGGFEGWAMWDRRLQSYAVVLRLFDGAGNGTYPPPYSRHGNRPLDYPTVDSLIHDLAARGLPLAPGSRAAIDQLANAVEGAEGPVELVGLTGDDGRRRLFCLPPSDSALELWPPSSHRSHRFQWGDRSPASYDTAMALVRFALGPMAPEELDVAAMGLVVEYLAGAGLDLSLSASGLCGWFLADEPLSATLRPFERRSLHRRLGLGAGARSSVEESSAAATPTGAGWSGLDRDGQ